MSVMDLLNQPWAITADKLEAMVAVYDRHAAGVRFDADSVKAALAITPTPQRPESGYTVTQGVAVIAVDGVLAKRMDMFTAISGGTSTEGLVAAVATAIADPTVNSILLAIDSPGGEVDGTQQIAQAIAECPKATMAWIDGLGCSAAYWIASQCDSIYASSDTTQVGSISVVMKHTDRSKANEQSGRTVTYITTGKYKALGNSDSPLSQDAREYMQGKADYLCDLFVGEVAEGLGVSPDTVWADMGEGRTFFAQQALDAGMIDGIASEEECLQKLVGSYQQSLQNPGSQSAGRKAAKGAPTMFKSFATEAEYNAHIDQIKTEAANGAKPTQAAIDGYKAEGANTERARIAAIEGTPLAAQYPDVVKSLKADGKSGGPEAAMAILAAEDKARGAHAENAKKDAPQPAPASSGTAAADAEKAKSAEEKKEAAEDSHALAAEIRTHIAKAKSEGRTIDGAKALAEIESARRAAKK